MNDERVIIIGAGVVGVAVGHILANRGYKIAAVVSRTHEKLERAKKYIYANSMSDVVKAASLGSMIFITTPDDQIKGVCDQIAERGAVNAGDKVFHMSGALSIDVLKAAKDKGAHIACMHPMQAFADIDGAIAKLPGSVFGVTADDKALPIAMDIVEDLGGKPVIILDEDKPVYHAAACAVSNYLVTLVRFGEDLYEAIGIDKSLAFEAFLPLLEGDLANIKRQGTVKALTGPIARGDVGTINKHMDAIKQRVPDNMDLYQLLGRYTVDIALDKGTLSKEKAKELLSILDGDKHD